MARTAGRVSQNKFGVGFKKPRLIRPKRSYEIKIGISDLQHKPTAASFSEVIQESVEQTVERQKMAETANKLVSSTVGNLGKLERTVRNTSKSFRKNNQQILERMRKAVTNLQSNHKELERIFKTGTNKQAKQYMSTFLEKASRVNTAMYYMNKASSSKSSANAAFWGATLVAAELAYDSGRMVPGAGLLVTGVGMNVAGKKYSKGELALEVVSQVLFIRGIRLARQAKIAKDAAVVADAARKTKIALETAQKVTTVGQKVRTGGKIIDLGKPEVVSVAPKTLEDATIILEKAKKAFEYALIKGKKMAAGTGPKAMDSAEKLIESAMKKLDEADEVYNKFFFEGMKKFRQSKIAIQGGTLGNLDEASKALEARKYVAPGSAVSVLEAPFKAGAKLSMEVTNVGDLFYTTRQLQAKLKALKALPLDKFVESFRPMLRNFTDVFDNLDKKYILSTFDKEGKLLKETLKKTYPIFSTKFLENKRLRILAKPFIEANLEYVMWGVQRAYEGAKFTITTVSGLKGKERLFTFDKAMIGRLLSSSEELTSIFEHLNKTQFYSPVKRLGGGKAIYRFVTETGETMEMLVKKTKQSFVIIDKVK